MKYAPPRILNIEEGELETRANGRSLIYEPEPAPPPCHNRVPGARARGRRPPLGSVPRQMARGAPGCPFAPHSE